jgi:fucose permease
MTSGPDSRLLPAISIYTGAVLLGVTLVSFPASSAFLRERQGISDIAYGSIYLPQLLAAIAGALLGSIAMRRMNLRSMYLVALVCFALSQAFLAMSVAVPAGSALILLMLGTGCFGFGFGFGGGPLNGFVPLLFPQRANTAIVALHMSAGAGLTIGPFVIGTLAAHDRWLFAPVGLASVAALLLVFAARVDLPSPPPGGPEESSIWPPPARALFFWIAALMAVLYSIAEGMFSNWAVLYVAEERGLSLEVAALALTCFWGSLTIGRLLVSVLVLWVKSVVLLAVLPALMAIAFIAVARIDSASGALLGFAFAGFACSGFFPLLVGFAAGPFPREVSWIASMLTAAMMVGVGIGSYVIGALREALSITVLYRHSILYPLVVLGLLVLVQARSAAVPAAARQGS